ncbi:MAG: 5'/3'-nucleotidase SurE [Acidimicrobiales bacterium]|nr:5'/3'-nucleotidase SurE [Acidimicrobiales bacterium]
MNLDPRHLLLVAALAVAPLAACSSDGSDGAAPETTAAESTETTVAEAAAPLRILVSNDDGVGAEGIDALVEGLLTLDDVEVTVVAPLEQQSGTGGSETEGEVATSEAETAGGYEATAVDGYPSDAVRVAVDEQGVEADLVVTGINEGQNLGPVIDASGTVGAARAAVARGIPALATSQGTGADAFDYEAAVPLILEWITERRDALAAGEAPVEVASMNIPSCNDGEVRGVLEVEPDVAGDGGNPITAQDCASTVPADDLDGDILAFNNGYATLSIVAPEPAGE